MGRLFHFSPLIKIQKQFTEEENPSHRFGFSILHHVPEEQWNCKTQESLTFPLTSKMPLQAESGLTEEMAQKGHKGLSGALTLGGI